MTINYQFFSMQFVKNEKSVDFKDCILLDDSNIEDCFSTLVNSGRNVVVKCEKNNGRQLVDYLHKNYIMVKAAGGIVENSNGDRLLMIRNDRFDLPKGKVEDGETLSEAALRETNEETGLGNLLLGSLALKTYHIYNLYGGWHFKQTSWYRMKLNGSQPLVPQTEEGITDLRWLPVKEWNRCLKDSYATMRIIAEQSFGR